MNARDTAGHPTRLRAAPTTQRYLVQSVSNVKVEKLVERSPPPEAFPEILGLRSCTILIVSVTVVLRFQEKSPYAHLNLCLPSPLACEPPEVRAQRSCPEPCLPDLA